MTAPRELILLDQAQRTLAEAKTIDDVKDLRDKTQAIQAYVRKARLGREILVEASTIRLRAERRLGEMLRTTPLANAAGGNQHTGPAKLANGDSGVGLNELGITKSDSSRWQKIAELPPQEFEQYLTTQVENQSEPTTAGLLRIARRRKPKPAQQCLEFDSAGVVRDLRDLVDASAEFSTIYADPPWPYANQATRASAGNHYPSMSVEAICSEPVEQLAAESAHLYHWVKPQMGIGNCWRVAHEFLLLGVKGRLTFQERGAGESWSVSRTVCPPPSVERPVVGVWEPD